MVKLYAATSAHFRSATAVDYSRAGLPPNLLESFAIIVIWLEAARGL